MEVITRKKQQKECKGVSLGSEEGGSVGPLLLIVNLQMLFDILRTLSIFGKLAEVLDEGQIP